MKILYVGEKINSPQNGGDMIELRNQKLLECMTGVSVVYIEPEFNSLTSRVSYGLSKNVKSNLRTVFSKEKIDLVFVSQSWLGFVLRYVKKKYGVRTLCFFHNAEIDFFNDMYERNKGGLKQKLYVWKMIIAEFLSIHYADSIITLNKRDSDALLKHYKRGTDFILPTTFDDSLKNDDMQYENDMDIDYLFLGSSFFANNEGVQWFIDNVLPYVEGNFYIVGKNMDHQNFKNLSDRVHIYGFVEDIASIYRRAKIVVSPIFSGSGMKTKTAEALMYGKVIVGTKEAFEGYVINDVCMHQCDTAQEFVNVLKQLIPEIKHSINKEARNHFVKYYSNEGVINSFKSFLEGKA